MALPVLTYNDPVTLHLNGEDVRLIPVPPAHTDGDTFIHFRGSDVLHLGDVFRTVAFPVIDRNNGGTLDGTIDALGIAAGIAGRGTKIVPGHGVVSSREDVIEFRDMIIDVGAKVRALVADGASYDEVVAAGPDGRVRGQVGRPATLPDRRLRGAGRGLTAGNASLGNRCGRGVRSDDAEGPARLLPRGSGDPSG